MSKKEVKFISVSAFEKAEGVKLNSKIKVGDLAKEAPDEAKIPKTFDFDPTWLKDYAFKEKGFFKPVVVKPASEQKKYEARVIRVDERVSIFMVTEKGTYSYRVLLDTIGIEEDGTVVNNLPPSSFKVFEAFNKETIGYDDLADEYPITPKRGEMAFPIENSILKLALEELKVFNYIDEPQVKKE